LIDRYGDGSSNTCVQPEELPVVMVVGAGRGPIVRAAMQVMRLTIVTFHRHFPLLNTASLACCQARISFSVFFRLPAAAAL